MPGPEAEFSSWSQMAISTHFLIFLARFNDYAQMGLVLFKVGLKGFLILEDVH